MLGFKTGIPADKVQELFCNETGYLTPKFLPCFFCGFISPDNESKPGSLDFGDYRGVLNDNGSVAA